MLPSESNKVGISLLRLFLQTAVRLTFVNTVNTVDIQITQVCESYVAERLNINTRFREVLVEEPKRKFCETWGEILRRERKKKMRGGGELRPTITTS